MICKEAGTDPGFLSRITNALKSGTLPLGTLKKPHKFLFRTIGSSEVPGSQATGTVMEQNIKLPKEVPLDVRKGLLLLFWDFEDFIRFCTEQIEFLFSWRLIAEKFYSLEFGL